jgi:hypothetical protein
MNFKFDTSKFFFPDKNSLCFQYFFLILRIGVLGQSMDKLTLIVSGDTPDANTSASQVPNVDAK